MKSEPRDCNYRAVSIAVIFITGTLEAVYFSFILQCRLYCSSMSVLWCILFLCVFNYVEAFDQFEECTCHFI